MEMHKQDQDLDVLHSAVKRLGVMSGNISAELDTQNKMLDEVNSETDRAQENLDIITKKTRELVKQAGKYHLGPVFVIDWLIPISRWHEKHVYHYCLEPRPGNFNLFGHYVVIIYLAMMIFQERLQN
jgi:hypothetical protein